MRSSRIPIPIGDGAALVVVVVVACACACAAPVDLRPKAALAAHELRVHRPAAAARILRELAEDNAYARLWLAVALVQDRRLAEAADELARAEDGWRNGALPRLATRLRATLALEAGRLAQAERLYAELARAGDGRARVGLAVVRARGGDWPAALVELDAAAAALPGAAIVYYDRALAHHALGDAPAALADAERAVAIDPLYPEARNNLAALYIDAGRLESAGLWLEQTVALAPDYAAAWGNLGAVRLLQDDVPGAIAALRRAVERAPSAPEHALNLGIAFLRSGDVDAARRELRRALSLDPANEAARRTLRFLEGKEKGQLFGDPPIAVRPSYGRAVL
ncbi:MAG TPA: tetratricopeptide repeat protein [Haliangiales bacterium]|nr:tetratricopeptide repeat protein [Haliangiales bacterium]